MNEHSKQKSTGPEDNGALTGMAIGGLVIVLTVAAPFMLMWGIAAAAGLLDDGDDDSVA